MNFFRSYFKEGYFVTNTDTYEIDQLIIVDARKSLKPYFKVGNYFNFTKFYKKGILPNNVSVYKAERVNGKSIRIKEKFDLTKIETWIRFNSDARGYWKSYYSRQKDEVESELDDIRFKVLSSQGVFDDINFLSNVNGKGSSCLLYSCCITKNLELTKYFIDAIRDITYIAGYWKIISYLKRNGEKEIYDFLIQHLESCINNIDAERNESFGKRMNRKYPKDLEDSSSPHPQQVLNDLRQNIL